MAKARRTPESRAPKKPPTRRHTDLIGIALLFVGAACLLALSWPQKAPIPEIITGSLRIVAGSGAYAIPLILMFVGAMFLRGFQRLNFTHATSGALLLFLTFVIWRHITAY